VFSTEV